VPSLRGIGVPPGDVTAVGAALLNLQLAGMIVGGLVFGALGDRRGRTSVLFGSILLYSAANFANAFVASVGAYGLLRFAAGFGLAGELGAGVTLVSELVDKERRGLATTLVASIGLCGAIAAGLVTDALQRVFGDTAWRYAYGLGGVLGLALLALRVGVLESGLFAQAAASPVARGDVRMLFRPVSRAIRFARVILVGMPIWFAGGVLFVFAPELGGALGLVERPTGGATVTWAYVGVVLGDIVSGVLSQQLRSRKRVLAGFLVAYALAVALLLKFGGASLPTFYALMSLVGFTTGYWVLFVTTASEQFGTNLRATVTTSAPNVVRGMAIPITMAWLAVKPALGVVRATSIVGLACIAIGLLALRGMRDSFGDDLDFYEE
jgi:MFS family permease